MFDWQFLVTLNERLRPLGDPVEIVEIAVRSIGEHLQASRVNYAQIEADEFVIKQSYVHGVPPLAGRGPVMRFGTATVDACRRGETVVVDDVQTDPRFTAVERAQLLESQIAAFVGAPLIKQREWVATLGVHSATARTWTRDQIALVEVVAERTWGASARARAEETLVRLEDRQAFLHELSDAIRPLSDPACILAETCRLLGMHLGVNRVAYAEIDGDFCTIVNDYVNGVASMAGRSRWTDMGGSRTGAILKGRTLWVNDTSTEPHTAAEREALQAAGIRAYICPVLVKDGRFLGSFGIHSRTPRIWTSDEIALVEDVCDRIWATVEHRKAEAELRANEEQLAFRLRLNDALRSLSDLGDVQETAARLLAEHLGVTRVGYAEVEGHEYIIRREFARGVMPLAGRRARISVGAELREALRRGETVAVADVQTDPRLGDADRATMRAAQIAAFIGVTLFKTGRMVAAFGANHDTPRFWTASEIELVRDVAERTWDAVERARAEAALRAQRQRLRVALEASAGGSWTWVAATNQVDWDERFRDLYGFTHDEPARTDAWLPRVHEEDRPRILALLDEMVASTTKDSWESTFRIVRPDGTVAWIQSRGRAERDADGGLIRLSGLDLDFDQHHRIEEARQARRDDEHDRALQTLLETATQGIVSVDARRVIVTANPTFESMFGWTSGESVGHPIEGFIPALFRDHEGSSGLCLDGTRKDGSTFPIEVIVNRVPAPSGGRAFVFVSDITERQRVASALRKRTAELEYRTAQLSQMASDLTLAEQRARERIAKTLHDGLQQLLVIVALNLEHHLKRESAGGAEPSQSLLEAQCHLDEAIAAARSLNMELFPPVLQHSGLAAALRWLATWTRDKYRLDVQVVVADPRADSPRKDVRTLLFESARELLFNAVKHAEADSVTLELALDPDDQLSITVTDQGRGFDPKRLDDRWKAGQAGWGLFSVRERLTLLGGRCDIDSAPGRGTRVRLVAPREAKPVAIAVETPEPLRILIADDHAAVRSALRQILQERPQLSVVGEASNGVDAIAHARTLRPNVILMDVGMPQMDGIEATRRIRAELPDIQILGLSMQERSEAVHAIERAGAAAFFVKGCDTQRLIDHLLILHASQGVADSAVSLADLSRS